METEHKIIFGDARGMKELEDESVDLMITSPPYPMIQMWDKMFGEHWFELEALREHQARVYSDHRKVNGLKWKLDLRKWFPEGRFIFNGQIINTWYEKSRT